jgi:hypothetical protein
MIVSKKGDAETRPILFSGEMIIGAILVIILFTTMTIFPQTLFASEQCTNQAEWSKFAESLQALDHNNKLESEVLFHNGENPTDCKLVAFSEKRRDNQNIETFYKGTLVPQDTTTVCLCKMDNLVCNAENCYAFETIKEILEPTQTQFSTVGLSGYLPLKMRRDADVLIIDLPLDDLMVKTISYTSKPELSLLDQGIINNLDLDLTFFHGQIPGFMPIVEKQSNAISPSAIPKAGNFPILFNLELGSTLNSESYSIEQFKTNARKIPTSLIRGSKFRITIPATDKSTVSTNEFRFYYNTGTWQNTPLTCEGTDDLICTAETVGFGKEFAISI